MVAVGARFAEVGELADVVDFHEGSRVVSSVREVIGADGPMVISNEIWRPRDDLRAVPGVPLRAETMAELTTAGFDPDLLVTPPEGWGQP